MDRGGPFDLSPERGRFALTYSLVEDKSFFFSVPLARFVVPDLGYANQHYVSLFAPAVSFVAIPGYLLGKVFGVAQVGAFGVVAIFAIINVWLISQIAVRLGASYPSAVLASLVFIFATPAFSYAVTLYQHHISTFLILMSIYILQRWGGRWPLFLVWFLCACSISVDYPNLFLMAPIGFYALGKFIKLTFDRDKIRLGINLPMAVSFLGIIIPLFFFFWFNKQSYGNPLQLSGTVTTASKIDKDGKPVFASGVNLEGVESYINPSLPKRSALGFFKTRNLLNGLYIHAISPDRGVLFFAPVILLGLLGLAGPIRGGVSTVSRVLVSTMFINLIFYSMWGDPWGGWAFGSRYLIPSYAILAIFLALHIDGFRKNLLMLTVFFVLATFSVFVNVAGALTSNANPPKIQVLSLEKQTGVVQKYTFGRNFDALRLGQTKSFVYQNLIASYLSAYQYYLVIVGAICLTYLAFLIKVYTSRD